MHVRTVRKPGEPGTHKLVAQYGDRLVTVRYRYDPATRKRYKTVELIVAEEDWSPPDAPPSASAVMSEPRRTTPTVAVRIHYLEKDLQSQIKSIGGQWDRNRKLWLAPEAHVERLGLGNRIVR